jgi:hypothetical protein
MAGVLLLGLMGELVRRLAVPGVLVFLFCGLTLLFLLRGRFVLLLLFLILFVLLLLPCEGRRGTSEGQRENRCTNPSN